MNLVLTGAVAAGGALGSVCRYLLSASVQQWAGRSFPWGTLLVNFAGCCAIGVLCVWFIERSQVGEGWRLFWMVGVLGGFTTFSTFSLEAFELAQHGRPGTAILYAASSLLLCVGGTVAGIMAARSF